MEIIEQGTVVEIREQLRNLNSCGNYRKVRESIEYAIFSL